LSSGSGSPDTRHPRPDTLRLVILAVVFASVAWTTLPQLTALVKLAFDLRPLSLAGRRERLMGPFYASARALNRELPPNEPVAIVARSSAEGDPSVFLNYYLAPRPTRLYANGWRQYGDDTSKGRPRTIVLVEGYGVRRATYAELRDADLRTGRVSGREPLQTMSGRFLVPIVSSKDGHSPESYVTEATIVNRGAAAVTMTVTLEPQHVVKTLTIAPGGREEFYDLVYQLFRRNEIGWLRVATSGPVDAAFWFVNRGPRQLAPMPLLTAMPALPIRLPALPGAKLWLLNPSDVAVTARVNGEPVTVGPRALLQRPAGDAITIEAGDNIIAFLSRKEGTRFVFPEEPR